MEVRTSGAVLEKGLGALEEGSGVQSVDDLREEMGEEKEMVGEVVLRGAVSGEGTRIERRRWRTSC